MTNINIQIPDELHKKIKLEAVKKDKTIKELIIETLNKTAEQNSKTETQNKTAK